MTLGISRAGWRFWPRLPALIVTLSLAGGVVAAPSVGTGDASPAAPLVEQAATLLDEHFGDRDVLRRAAELLGEARAADPDYARLYVEAARLTIKGGHLVNDEFAGGTLEAAEFWLSKAIALDSEYPDAHVVMGHLLRQTGECPRAFEHLDKAKALKTSNPWLQNNYADCLEASGRPDQAKEIFEQVIARGAGTDAATRNAYVDAATKLQWYAAVAGVNREVKRYAELATAAAAPKDAWTWGNVAMPLFLMGQNDEAERYARKALSIMDYGPGREALALTLYSKWARHMRPEDAPAAEPIFDEAYALFPDLDRVIAIFESGAPSVSWLSQKLRARRDELAAR